MRTRFGWTRRSSVCRTRIGRLPRRDVVRRRQRHHGSGRGRVPPGTTVLARGGLVFAMSFVAAVADMNGRVVLHSRNAPRALHVSNASVRSGRRRAGRGRRVRGTRTRRTVSHRRRAHGAAWGRCLRVAAGEAVLTIKATRSAGGPDGSRRSSSGSPGLSGFSRRSAVDPPWAHCFSIAIRTGQSPTLTLWPSSSESADCRESASVSP